MHRYGFALLLAVFVLAPVLLPAASALDPQGVFPFGPDARALEEDPSVARDPQGNVLLAYSRVTNFGTISRVFVQPLRLDGTIRARSRGLGLGRAAAIAYAGQRFVVLTALETAPFTLSSQALDGLGRPIGTPEVVVGVAPSPNFNLRRNLAGGALLVGHDPSGGGLVAQRFDAAGRKIGPPQTLVDEISDLADCGSDLQGRVVVAWRRGFGEIAFRRYTADLTPLGEIGVISGSSAQGLHLSVAPDGRFAVVYGDGRDQKVRLALFRADGTQARPPLVLGVGSISYSGHLELGFDADGRWLALWSRSSFDDFYDSRIDGRFVSGDGSAVGRLFRIAQATTHVGGFSSLRLLRTGPREHLVFWRRTVDDVDEQIHARRLFDVPGGDDPCVLQGGALRCDLKHDGGTAEVSYSLPLQTGERPILFDADGDTRLDPCVVRGGSTQCDVDRDGTTEASFPFALSGTALVGDLDGDGYPSLCFHEAGTFHCRQLLQLFPQADVSATYGAAGERPLLGDVDGDKRADFCSASATRVQCAVTHANGTVQLVLPVAPGVGEAPFLADVNDDGKADLCGYAAGTFRCHFAGRPDLVLPFGGAGAIPLMGNIDGR